MDALMLHADRAQTALVHAGREPWVASPQAGVQRRLLERIGGEVATASSIVRYLPGSRFSAHSHELGEEYMVLEGTFSDEQGHYPAGTYVRNPPGSRHAPFSAAGCVIFVKLRQMASHDTLSLRVFVADRRWVSTQARGHQRCKLLNRNGVSVQLERLDAGAATAPVRAVGGEEVLVIEGSVRLLDNERTSLDRWSWLRRADTSRAGFSSKGGALLWIKRGHLATTPNEGRG